MRSKICRKTCLLAAALLIATMAHAKVLLMPVITVTPAPPKPVGTPGPELLAALAALSADDFQTRESAQRIIDAVPRDSRDLLKSLQTAQKDPEVIARLQRHLDELDADLAIDPPPLSLHLQNASATGVLQSISDQIRLPVRSVVMTPGTSYTLDLERRPFSDVYGLLCRAGIDFQPGPLKLPVIHIYQNYKGFTAYFSGITTTKSVSAKGELYQQTVLAVGVLADPRIRVLGVYRPQLTKIVDSAGNVLLDRQYQPNYSVVETPQTGSWEDAVGFPVLANAGDRIATMTGEARFVVQVSSESKTIEDAEKHVGEEFTVGDRVFVLEACKVSPEEITFALASRNKALHPHELLLTNAKGETLLHSYRMFRDEARMPGIGAGPLTLKITTPTKVREISVPFELKDVPNPH